MKKFEKELKDLINKHSLENKTNTPDFILAEYLVNCLKNYNKLQDGKDRWYGKKIPIFGVKECEDERQRDVRVC